MKDLHVELKTNGLEAVIYVNYKEKIETKAKKFERKKRPLFKRIFGSKERYDFHPIETEEFKYKTYKNLINLKIETKYKRYFSKITSGGNYDFHDDFDDGYTLIVTIEHFDKKLQSEILKKLRRMNFLCYPSEYSAHCHINSEFPTENEARKLLTRILESISGQKIN